MRSDLRGERLLALRELRAITQAQMAKDLGVSASALSLITKGEHRFTERIAAAACETYRVPAEFFAVATDLEDIGPLTFKKKSTARVRDEKRVSRLYTEAARLFRHASAASDYRQADLPDPADFNHDPEAIALEVRRRVGLGADDPVGNVVRLCERLGVGVVDDLDTESNEELRHSGVSRPSAHSTRPLIAVVTDLDPALKRFTIAHELYHLIADRDIERPLSSTRDPRERSADLFAGALLLPEPAARDRLTPGITLHGFLRVKADYGVEVRGLIHRANDLRIIDKDRARSLYIQWSSSGWRAAEPVEIPDERPLLLGQALQKVHGRNYAARASHVIGVPAELTAHWTAANATTPEVDRPDNVVSLMNRRRA